MPMPWGALVKAPVVPRGSVVKIALPSRGAVAEVASVGRFASGAVHGRHICRSLFARILPAGEFGVVRRACPYRHILSQLLLSVFAVFSGGEGLFRLAAFPSGELVAALARAFHLLDDLPVARLFEPQRLGGGAPGDEARAPAHLQVVPARGAVGVDHLAREIQVRHQTRAHRERVDLGRVHAARRDDRVPEPQKFRGRDGKAFKRVAQRAPLLGRRLPAWFAHVEPGFFERLGDDLSREQFAHGETQGVAGELLEVAFDARVQPFGFKRRLQVDAQRDGARAFERRADGRRHVHDDRAGDAERREVHLAESFLDRRAVRQQRDAHVFEFEARQPVVEAFGDAHGAQRRSGLHDRVSRPARPAVPVAGRSRGGERQTARRQDERPAADLLAARDEASHLAESHVERANLHAAQHLDAAVLEGRPEGVDDGRGVLPLARVEPVSPFLRGDEAASEEERDGLLGAELCQRGQQEVAAAPVVFRERPRVVLRAGEVAAAAARDHQLAAEFRVFFDQRGAGAVLRGPRGGHHPRRAAADHDNVECAHRFLLLRCRAKKRRSVETL